MHKRTKANILQLATQCAWCKFCGCS